MAGLLDERSIQGFLDVVLPLVQPVDLRVDLAHLLAQLFLVHLRVRDVLVQRLESMKQHGSAVGPSREDVVADVLYGLDHILMNSIGGSFAEPLRRLLALLLGGSVAVHEDGNENVHEDHAREEHPGDEEDIGHDGVDVSFVVVADGRPQVHCPEERLPHHLYGVGYSCKVPALIPKVEMSDGSVADEHDAEDQAEVVKMYHGGAQCLVDNLQARLKLVVLEEPQSADEDRDEVDGELVAVGAVELFKDGIVVVGGDADRIADDVFDVSDANDDEHKVACVVDEVQTGPHVEKFM
mmetsp:Transcript_9415/g.21422  ORF Transcript_9415/g.21422 Transcript_9415/m.21422 type:complete len:295 (+) Transcript_9415:928-1812(+)